MARSVGLRAVLLVRARTPARRATAPPAAAARRGRAPPLLDGERGAAVVPGVAQQRATSQGHAVRRRGRHLVLLKLRYRALRCSARGGLPLQSRSLSSDSGSRSRSRRRPHRRWRSRTRAIRPVRPGRGTEPRRERRAAELDHEEQQRVHDADERDDADTDRYRDAPATDPPCPRADAAASMWLELGDRPLHAGRPLSARKLTRNTVAAASAMIASTIAVR